MPDNAQHVSPHWAEFLTSSALFCSPGITLAQALGAPLAAGLLTMHGAAQLSGGLAPDRLSASVAPTCNTISLQHHLLGWHRRGFAALWIA